MLPRHGGATDIGRLRKKNEDSYDVRLPTAEEASWGYLYVVADGVGGEASGEAASRLAVETALREYYAYPEPDPPAALRQAVERANAAVHASAVDRRATTLVAAAVVGQVLHVASVGDSRLYLVRGDQVRQVTWDHSWVQEQVRAGSLDPEAARSHPLGNVITRWLGQPSVEPDLFSLPLEEGDRIVICTDGLIRHVDEATIGDVVGRLEPEPAAQRLVALANEGGGMDNITVVVVVVGGDSPPRSDTHSLPVVAESGIPSSGPPRVERARPRLGRWALTGLALVVLAAVIVGVAVFLPRALLAVEVVIPVGSPPSALAVASDGALFVGNREGSIRAYDLGLADRSAVIPNPLLLLGLRQPSPAATWQPDGAEPIAALAVGPESVYTVAGDRVVVYSRKGEYLRAFVLPAGGQLGQPRALAVDSSGRMYVSGGGSSSGSGTGSGSGSGSGKVIRLDAEGALDPSWAVASRVELRAPAALALASDGSLYVADADAGRVIRLDPNGELAESWSGVGEVSLVNPQALALADGRLFVADVGLKLVLQVTGLQLNGPEVSGASGSPAFRRQELGGPLSLAADGAGSLYIGNASTSQVTVTRLGGSLARLPFGGR